MQAVAPTLGLITLGSRTKFFWHSLPSHTPSRQRSLAPASQHHAALLSSPLGWLLLFFSLNQSFRFTGCTSQGSWSSQCHRKNPELRISSLCPATSPGPRQFSEHQHTLCLSSGASWSPGNQPHLFCSPPKQRREDLSKSTVSYLGLSPSRVGP